MFENSNAMIAVFGQCKIVLYPIFKWWQHTHRHTHTQASYQETWSSISCVIRNLELNRIAH